MLFPLVCLLVLSCLAGTIPAFAQTGGVSVDIFGPGQRKLSLVILPPRDLKGGLPPNLAAEFEKYVRQDLDFLPFLQTTPVSELLGGDPSKGVRIEEIDLRPLRLAKVDLIVTMGWEGNSVQARVYDTLSGRRLVGKAYPGLDAQKTPLAADAFCAEFMRALTGRSGFFNSDLAFVRKVPGGREIFTVSPQGRNLKQATKTGGINLSPEWDKEGRRIIFTHVGEKSHSLGVLTRATGKVTMRTFPGFTVISPAFLPDGDVAVTLAIKGQPDIYRLSKSFKIMEPLADSRSIEVSPSFDSKGLRMAFVSDSRGNPHIFVKEMSTGEVKRVTYEGKYNTSPCLSPDGRYIAFSRQLPGGHKIFVHDLITGQEKQITFGPGSDEEPAFGPDGYFIAFSSNRGGQYQIYLTTRHGDEPKLVPTGAGEATAPSWDTSRIKY
ncbi:protein tolB [Paucidesulfovibrio longus]|uniref:protein tolB n=1 Tax=Paucidesulfovibrio longus TaxID=889 RepID=UPI0004206C07|nr:protein tolB [Paucidesulfovibrio longus]